MAISRDAPTACGLRGLAALLALLVGALCLGSALPAPAAEAECPGLGPAQAAGGPSGAPDPAAIVSEGAPPVDGPRQPTGWLALPGEERPPTREPTRLHPRAPPLPSA